MVAHFDYYYNYSSPAMDRGVILIPKTYCGRSKMYSENNTLNGYTGSIAYITTIPLIATALSTVLGTYLKKQQNFLTSAVDASIASMAGSNMMGGSTTGAWYENYVVLPSEVQIHGDSAASSSVYENMDTPMKLAVFNFITVNEYARNSCWLRSIMGSTQFVVVNSYGNVTGSIASTENYLRPIIYIG